MKINSIRFKFMGLIVVAFLVTTIGIALLANRQLTNMADRSQTGLYLEKLYVIINTVGRYYQLQQDSLTDETIIAIAQVPALNNLRDTYYTGTNVDIYPFIIDSEGIVVMHPVLERGDTSIASLDFIQTATQQKVGALYYEYLGVSKWMIFGYFEPWDWIVGYAIPLETKYADVRQFMNDLLLTMGGITALVLIGVLVAINRVAQPIINLTQAASQMAAGNLDHEIHVPRSQDEIGILARSFVDMRASIQAQITAMNEEIARRVRTDLALEESEQRYSQAINSVGVHIYMNEMDENGVSRGQYISPYVETLTGYPQENFTNWDFVLSLVHPNDRAIAETQLYHLNPGEANEAEYRLTRADGEEIWVRDSARSERKDDGIVTFGVIGDITERKLAEAEREQMQQDIIQAQRHALREISTPIIPVMERIIVLPLVGSIDTERASNITRRMLAGIGEHRAKFVILDITGVPIVDNEVANYLNKAIHAARLKGAQVVLTGISNAVAETIPDLGLDWTGVETLRDLQTGLVYALDSFGLTLTGQKK